MSIHSTDSNLEYRFISKRRKNCILRQLLRPIDCDLMHHLFTIDRSRGNNKYNLDLDMNKHNKTNMDILDEYIQECHGND